MTIMQTAVEKEDWELMQKGLPPRKKKVVQIPNPEMPEVENLLKFEDIPLDKFEKLISARRRKIDNKEGVKFIGFDVVMEVRDKRKPGRPPKDEEKAIEELEKRIISGWMLEGEWYKVFRHIRDKIDFKVISL